MLQFFLVCGNIITEGNRHIERKKRNMNNNENKKNKIFKNPMIIFLIISMIATIILNFAVSAVMAPSKTEITYDKFMKMIDEDKVSEVVIEKDRFLIYGKEEEKKTETIMGIGFMDFGSEAQRPIYYTGFLNDERLFEKLDEKGITYSTPVEYNNPILDFVLTWILPLLFMYLIVMLLMRFMSKKMGGGGGIMGIGQSHAKMYNIENTTGITFKDVAGQEEAKESLTEIVDFLHNPTK